MTSITKDLTLCHANVRSLLAGVDLSKDIRSQPSKLDEVELILVHRHDFDIITISESWLDHRVTDGDLAIKDYDLERKDISSQQQGLLVYIKSSITKRRRKDLEPGRFDIQMICIELTINKKKILLYVTYRPPGQRVREVDFYLECLQHSLDLGISENPDFIFITGDLNDRCQNWHDSHATSELGKKLYNLVNDNNMTQLINEPTRITTTSKTILDLIVTSSPAIHKQCGTLDPIDTSDHRVVFTNCSITVRKPTPLVRAVYHYKNGDYEGLNDALRTADWQNIINPNSGINDITENFTSVLSATAKEFIPYRKVTLRQMKKPFHTLHIERLIKIRNRWSARYNRTKNLHDKEIRDRYRKLVKFEVKEAKKKYHARIFNELNDSTLSPKKYWQHVNCLTAKKVKPIIPTLVDNGVEYTSDKEKAELLNSYFAEQSTLPPLPSNFSLPNFTYRTDARLSNVEFTEANVFKTLKALKTNKACGHDHISNTLLKNTRYSISKPLSEIFTISMTTKTYPSIWKLANVVSLYKKELQYVKENYRPISLLPCMSKVMERLVFNSMYEYAVRNNLLTRRNSGFKKNDSTINQLIKITHDIYTGLENHNDVCLVFLDVSKAFDRVYHEGLIFKLKQLGITGNLLDWLRSYLCKRKQRVTINGEASSWKETNAGVPQGSILGPLLFLFFINDITDNIQSNISLFADDTSLMETVTDITISFNQLNQDLATLQQWADQWRVKFNASKTVFMYITLKHTPPMLPTLYLNNTSLKEVDNHTHLGITLNNKMTWDHHIDRISTKAMVKLTSLKRIRHLIPKYTALTVYKTQVRSILEYGDVLFDNMTTNLKLRLYKVHREAAIAISRAFRRTCTARLLNDVGLEPLSERRKVHRLSYLHRMVYNNCPSYLKELLPSGNNETYSLRSEDQIRLPRVRLVRFGHAFLYKTCKDWNTLDHDSRSIVDTHKFNKQLKRKFCLTANKAFYAGNEPGQTHHTRMRLGLSHLKAHLHQHHIIDDPYCQFCHNSHENNTHFLLKCPRYNMQRTVMLNKINRLLSDSEIKLIAMSNKSTTSLLLQGDIRMDTSTTIKLFKIVQEFIQNSQRFM